MARLFLLLINIEPAFPRHTTTALNIVTWYTELRVSGSLGSAALDKYNQRV